jgi:hypothetical protein
MNKPTETGAKVLYTVQTHTTGGGLVYRQWIVWGSLGEAS